MKKASMGVALLMVMGTMASAQRMNIQNAINALRNNEYDEAIEYIEMAEVNPSTADDPKTWVTKGDIYIKIQADQDQNKPEAYQKAAAAYMKAAELKSNYERAKVTQNLLSAAYNYYNDAVRSYNEKDLEKAYSLAKGTLDIYQMEEGKRFSNPGFDTVASQARVLMAYSAFNSEDYNKAIPVLQKLVEDPISQSANFYILLASSYARQNQDDAFLKTIEEGLAKYPDNVNLRNEELNYYIRNNRQADLIEKLKKAMEAEPSNAEYAYNLGKVYLEMAFPNAGSQGEDSARPAEFDSYIKEAETHYSKALSLDPNNPGYQYEAGVLYYNQASEIDGQMVQLGTSEAENKKYNELAKQRNALFDKAEPYFLKVVSLLEPRLAEATNDDKFVMESALKALSQMYARQDKLEKAQEMKNKLDNL